MEEESSPNQEQYFKIIRDARKQRPLLNETNQLKFLKFNYNRKEKSLEKISKKFLKMFLDREECVISLDQITKLLGVERRRIYDIINILESLRLITRHGKNNYRWNGFDKIYQAISDLINSKTEQIIENKHPLIKKEKSLESLSISFLKLFLQFKEIMTLEQSAQKLCYIPDQKIKTKIRRLYDIANVFQAIGLIKKTVLKTKKPAFLWIGLKGVEEFVKQIRAKQQKKYYEQFQATQNIQKQLNQIINSSSIINELIRGQIQQEQVQSNQTSPSVKNGFLTPVIKKTNTIIQFPNPTDILLESLNNTDSTDNTLSTQDSQYNNSNQMILKKSFFDISQQSKFKKIIKYDDQSKINTKQIPQNIDFDTMKHEEY